MLRYRIALLRKLGRPKTSLRLLLTKRKSRRLVFVLAIFCFAFAFSRSDGGVRPLRGDFWVECGFPGISRQECEVAGCKFVTSGGCKAIIKLGQGMHSAFGFQCDVERSRRSDCGFPGISAHTCRSQGCCHSPAYGCYFPGSVHNQLHSSRQRDHPPVFSIIVTCYGNDAKFLRSALHSVLGQSYASWELIIVDDGSAGKECLKAANLFIEEYELGTRARALYKKNGFIADARNFGIQLASGSFILPLDADDFLSPNFLLEAATEMESDKLSQVFYADQLFFGKKGSAYWWYLWPHIDLHNAKQRGPLPVTTIYHKQVFKDVQGYKIDMIYGNEDYDFWLSVLQLEFRTKKLRGISSWYRLKEESMHDGGSYKSIGLDMIYAHNPYLYSIKMQCAANAAIFCHIDKVEDASRLRQAVEKQPNSCSGWLWLAFYKLKKGCVGEARALLSSGLAVCQSPLDPRKEYGVNSGHLQLAHMLAWVASGAKGLQKMNTMATRYEVADESRTMAMCSHAFLQHTSCVGAMSTLIDKPFPKKPAQNFSSAPVVLKMADEITRAEGSTKERREHFLQHLGRSHDRISRARKASIPNIIHFVYGLRNEAAYFEMIHYIAVRSALETNPGCLVYLHFFIEPKGRWWNALQNDVIAVPHKHFDEYQGRCVAHHSHKADVLRLEVLHKFGGIYLDIDTVSLRPWSPYLQGNEFVMAWQDSSSLGTVREGKTYGLCNAAMASAAKSWFSKVWLSSYKYFRSNGRDDVWDEHSVILPANLTEEYPWILSRGHLTILKSHTLWDPLWDSVEVELLGPERSLDLETKYPRALMIHLWRGGDRIDVFNDLEASCGWLTKSPFGRTVSKYVTCLPGSIAGLRKSSIVPKV